ncbi:hypothetical protein [Pluralibacter gergoviae]|uniref:hypothetical protein n=1 Tax=Pluralibacter gergoviae TaxID=61647 RepID=UPI0006505666|nr:hypothetical protein [Pluralibacter gergoviae]EKV0932055.1 hypothetical protein [Pluralibacter gergoviae]EKV6247165.1 hypothetical protein [Pluralibacter gergoviae]EKW9964829.1 hypothetical protein [Pluralibacter gergoviae]ELC3072620.1 hypothetical protein [Pluralibacter gergoviae]ELD4269999.1 hypothetical protein [Pluralibacter gergoviae]
METTAVWQLSVPPDFIDVEADFVTAAAHCERLAVTAQETENMATQRELYQLLNSGLNQLLPVLNEPIPDADREAFTVDTLPASSPMLDCDSDLLCEYCLALSELLGGGRMSVSVEEALQGLLSDLIRLLTDHIAAPRWLRTAEGVQPLV